MIHLMYEANFNNITGGWDGDDDQIDRVQELIAVPFVPESVFDTHANMHKEHVDNVIDSLKR